MREIFDILKKIGLVWSIIPIFLIVIFSKKTETPLPIIDSSFASFYFSFFVIFCLMTLFLSFIIIIPSFLLNNIKRSIFESFDYYYFSYLNIAAKRKNQIFDYFLFNLPFLTFLTVCSIFLILQENNNIFYLSTYLFLLFLSFTISTTVSICDFYYRMKREKHVNTVNIFKLRNLREIFVKCLKNKSVSLRIILKFSAYNIVANVFSIMWYIIFAVLSYKEIRDVEEDIYLRIFTIYSSVIFLHFFQLMPEFDIAKENGDRNNRRLLFLIIMPIYVLLFVAPGATTLTKSSLRAISDGGSSPVKIMIKEPNPEGKTKISPEYGCAIFSTASSIVIKITSEKMDEAYCEFGYNYPNFYNNDAGRRIHSKTRTYDRRDIIYIEKFQKSGSCVNLNCEPIMGRPDFNG